MKIFIITENPFPFGMAATNRILSYCKGFIENKAKEPVSYRHYKIWSMPISHNRVDNTFTLKLFSQY